MLQATLMLLMLHALSALRETLAETPRICEPECMQLLHEYRALLEATGMEASQT